MLGWLGLHRAGGRCHRWCRRDRHPVGIDAGRTAGRDHGRAAAPGPVQLDHRVNVGAQMVSGAVIGTYVSASTLSGIGGAWLPVLVITICTLALTFAAGLGWRG